MHERINYAGPPQNTQENKESKEIFRASLGFDFIFSKDEDGGLHAYCIEINGQDSGVTGVASIPEGAISKIHKVVAGVRAEYNKKMVKKIRLGNEIRRDLLSGEFQATPEGEKQVWNYLERSIRSNPTFKNAYHNPTFIEDITRDKRLQDHYIPVEYLPRTWHPGDSPISRTDLWVAKYYGSRGGDNVFVMSNLDFQMSFLKEADIDQFVIQEFIPSAGAQAMPESVGTRPASMRLLMDFRFLENGTIQTDFSTAYQRVGAPLAQDGKVDVLRSWSDLTKRYVVNLAKNAESHAASPQELEMARTAAEAIIRNIADEYKDYLSYHKEYPETD